MGSECRIGCTSRDVSTYLQIQYCNCGSLIILYLIMCSVYSPVQCGQCSYYGPEKQKAKAKVVICLTARHHALTWAPHHHLSGVVCAFHASVCFFRLVRPQTAFQRRAAFTPPRCSEVSADGMLILRSMTMCLQLGICTWICIRMDSISGISPYEDRRCIETFPTGRPAGRGKSQHHFKTASYA